MSLFVCNPLLTNADVVLILFFLPGVLQPMSSRAMPVNRSAVAF